MRGRLTFKSIRGKARDHCIGLIAASTRRNKSFARGCAESYFRRRGTTFVRAQIFFFFSLRAAVLCARSQQSSRYEAATTTVARSLFFSVFLSGTVFVALFLLSVSLSFFGRFYRILGYFAPSRSYFCSSSSFSVSVSPARIFLAFFSQSSSSRACALGSLSLSLSLEFSPPPAARELDFPFPFGFRKFYCYSWFRSILSFIIPSIIRG